MSTSSRALAGWGLAAAVMTVALLCYPVEVLAVRSARGDGLLWAARAAPGDAFRLRWTHTVTLRPVEEEYEVGSDRRLHLRQMIFDQFGPNLPAGPEEGTQWKVEWDRWVVTGYQIDLERLNLGLSHLDHRLMAGGHELDLVRTAGPNALVRLQIERIPRFFIIVTEGKQWRNRARLR